MFQRWREYKSLEKLSGISRISNTVYFQNVRNFKFANIVVLLESYREHHVNSTIFWHQLDKNFDALGIVPFENISFSHIIKSSNIIYKY